MTIEKLVPMDYVYQGLRVDAKGVRFLCLQCVDEKGKLIGTPRHYDYKRIYERIVGQIYRGAEFGEKSSKGLNIAKWAGPYMGPEDVLRWEAFEREAEAEYKLKKAEADAGKTSALEALLLPLRREYARLVASHDVAGAHALTRGVTLAIMKPPRAHEKTRL